MDEQPNQKASRAGQTDKIDRTDWVCAFCEVVNRSVFADQCRNCKAKRSDSLRTNWIYRCLECQGALARDQTCSCKPKAFKDKYRDESPERAHVNPWKIPECRCQNSRCRNNHFTTDEKERIKKVLWAHKPHHPEGTFRPRKEEACLSMAMHCSCRFGTLCAFSHDQTEFPPGLMPQKRPAGIKPPQVHRQDRQDNPSTHQLESRKRNSDDQYSVQGHGFPKHQRTGPRPPGGKGGQGAPRRDWPTDPNYHKQEDRSGGDESSFSNKTQPKPQHDHRSRDRNGRRQGSVMTKEEYEKTGQDRAYPDEFSD